MSTRCPSCWKVLKTADKTRVQMNALRRMVRKEMMDRAEDSVMTAALKAEDGQYNTELRGYARKLLRRLRQGINSSLRERR